MKKYDPVLFLYGSEHFQRRRFLRQLIFQAECDGWQVDFVSGENKHQIYEALDSTGVLFGNQLLLVVEQPEKLDQNVIIDHSKSLDSSVVLLLYYEGNNKDHRNLIYHYN